MLQRSLIRRFSSKVEPRAFEEIPGPKALPLIGTLYKYLPLIGEYDMKKLHKNGAAKYAEYGPLVREEIVLGEPIVWVFRPEDIAEVFKADTGRYPERRSHRALFKYRLDRRWIYNSGGLLPTNGPDWWRLRKEFQKALSRPRNVVNYAEDTDEIVRRFVSVCEDGRFDDALPLLSRLFLELTCLVAFDLKIDAFSEREMLRDSMSSRLVDAAFTTNSVILRLDNGPRLWRFFDTPKYRKLCRAQAYMEEVAVKMVSEKLEKLKDEAPNEKQSLLEIYLQNPELDFKDVVGMACDMLLAGIDTTTYSSAFALYHLSRNPETLDKLHAEASRLIPDDSCVVTAETLKSAIYTKAVIKETFRLNPISVGVGRILQTDVVLNGYHVRKGTNVVTQNQISCRLPEYFEKPDSFMPERWLRETGKNEKPPIHPYLVLPFGHGPRSCIARRLAEQNMQILLLRMCRQLRFDWAGGELDVDSFLINKPNAPIKLNFSARCD
ncbi:cytochrome P450 302a1, mitochondrial [Nasonia vitripennis]|uniref:Cytochrome P450 302a1, mitochondrial n=1 Tax=Nasonia vitripennis TaxID=7425 RepID=A0A7M7GC54_NASVI|nr:cytochrome P450 302a1, mitochondrial [Nasonia vitripennis]